MRKKINLTTTANLLLLLATLQVGCGVSARLENRPSVSSEPTTPSSSATPIPTEVPTGIKLEYLIGCWSSGSGNIIRITDKQIFYYTKKFKPVNYVVEKSDPNVLVLRLTDRPQFYIFQEFISLEIDKNEDPMTGFPLTILDYISRENFDKQSPSGRSGWVKSDCKEWFKE